MARIPVRFERVAAAFDSAAVVRLCKSSGSEHSPEDDDDNDLSDLVKSFIERDGVVSEQALLDIDIFDPIDDIDQSDQNNGNGVENHQGSDNEGGYSWSDSEKKDSLRKLLGHNDDGDDDVKRKLFDEAKIGYGVCGDIGSIGFKRRLMTHLRNKGFDAGLCKSKWEKSKRFPAGDYEYIDVNVDGGGRYIVEPNIVGEFEIARPSDQYTSLVEIFPQVFVGKVGELKQIVRLMSSAMRHSMKNNAMPLPPWRRNGYMQAKWFGSYKRTTKSTPSKTPLDHKKSAYSYNSVKASLFESKRSIGFEFDSFSTMPFYCNSGFAPKVGLRVSNLTAAFGG